MAAFDTETTERDCWRAVRSRGGGPKQMLQVQEYDGHASIHDDATAQKLGFQGGTIEGPTHFSQFAPLLRTVWGEPGSTHGCLSAHFRNPALRARWCRPSCDQPEDGRDRRPRSMERRDGGEILSGTASVGDLAETALEQRLAS